MKGIDKIVEREARAAVASKLSEFEDRLGVVRRSCELKVQGLESRVVELERQNARTAERCRFLEGEGALLRGQVFALAMAARVDEDLVDAARRTLERLRSIR